MIKKLIKIPFLVVSYLNLYYQSLKKLKKVLWFLVKMCIRINL